jgi:hypothetical protein
MLQKIQFKPGFNKQATETGAEGQWIDGNNVRFRYGQAEKIGGWEQLVASQIAGPVRDQHTWTDLNGKKYAALGTSKVLVIYYESDFYDITLSMQIKQDVLLIQQQEMMKLQLI